jgi:drug/metabolite transporter (DMT)-like permease
MKNTWVYISVLLAMIMWSMTFVWFKIVNEALGPFTIVFLRLLISSLILLMVSWFARLLQSIRGKDIIRFLILSLIYPVIYFVAESLGLTLIQASLAAVIISTIPLFVPIGAYMLYRERLSALNIVGVLISFIGVLIVVLKRDLSFNAAPVGFLLMLIAVLAAVGYTLMVKKMTETYTAFSITTYQNIFGTLLFLPLFLIFEWKEFSISAITPRAALNLGYLAVFGSSLAFIFFNYSIKVLGAARTELFTNIIPVGTAVFAFFILDEPLGVQKLIGIAIVLTGLFLSQIKSHKKVYDHIPAP